MLAGNGNDLWLGGGLIGRAVESHFLALKYLLHQQPPAAQPSTRTTPLSPYPLP